MQPGNITLKAWDALKTITTFDDGSEDSSHICNDVVNSQVIGFQSKASTPISLLVESLVQQLCTLLEQDATRATDLYNAICGKLHQMNLIDETYSMGEFEVMRSQYQKALYQLVTVARGPNMPVNIQSSTWPLAQTSGMEWSRYYREFDEIKFIAGGGFGKVYKARHKLDGLEYAVKKVCIKSSIVGNVMVHLSEVKTLASLNHTNIVSYKAAWLEPYLGNKDNAPPPSISEENTYASYTASPQDSYNTNRTTDDSSSLSICFEDPENPEDPISSSNTQNDEDNNPELANNSTNNKSCKQICMYNNSKLDLTTEKFVDLKWATLYIQMALCQMTLRQWLDKRNQSASLEQFYTLYRRQQQQPRHSVKESGDVAKRPDTASNKRNNKDSNLISRGQPDTNESSAAAEESIDNSRAEHQRIVVDILKQLARGLSYIHSRGIVHHDIKPSNIFIDTNEGEINVQLGDFGLACPLKNVHSDAGFGTPLYAAPEQLKGECDFKSDVYSLGIIMLELLQPFSTEMERAENLKALGASGKLNEDLKRAFPELSKLILKLTKRRPEQRCTTDELLLHLENIYSHNENYEKDKTIDRLKSRVAELDEKVKDKDNEIENLKMIIKNLKQ